MTSNHGRAFGRLPTIHTPQQRGGPNFAKLHRFHVETRKMGKLSEDGRRFTKMEFKGRLSLVTEDEVHSQGIMRYVVQFTAGELSSADGVGFVFSPKLPCSKNIQHITSIFVNRVGRICMRGGSEVVRSDVTVKQLELGDWIEMTVNLQDLIADFTVWPDNSD